MPQNEYIEEALKKHGRRLDHAERARKKAARAPHDFALEAKRAHGLKAKQLNRKRRLEKIDMRKRIHAHEVKTVKGKDGDDGKGKMRKVGDEPLPTYLLERPDNNKRRGPSEAKILSNLVKEKRKEKAGKWTVPVPAVKGIAEADIFQVVKTGKRKQKSWKRMITKPCFVGDGFTRKPPKLERFIRPMGLRMRKANVTHPELKTTFQLPIIGVKKNPQGPMYSQLGVLTRGTVIEVNCADLGLVTSGGKIVWGKYAQITNNPENDGCVNAVLIV